MAPAVSCPVLTAKRRDRLALEAARPDAGEGVGQRRQHAGELGQRIAAQRTQEIGAEHQRDAGEADQHARDLAAGHLLVGGEQVGDDHAPDRRGRVEDGGEAAGDLGLAPAEQQERDDVVDQRQQQDRAPRPARQPERAAAPPHIGPQRQRGEADPQPDVGDRRNLAHRDADEHEGAAPDDGEREHQAPVGAVHDVADHRHRIGARGLRSIPRLAVKTIGLSRRHWLAVQRPGAWPPTNAPPPSISTAYG